MNAQKMLINALHPEDLRIAIIKDNELEELEVDSSSSTNSIKGNIYKAKVDRIEPSLQAAFIDIGTNRNAFLQINDVHPSYYCDQSFRHKKFDTIPIKKVLKEGQEIIVQVVKEERGEKGATLTTYLSLPGRYTVLMPGTKHSGVSKKIQDNQHRARISKIYSELDIPVGMGIIVRTAGYDRSIIDIKRDLELQLKLWEEIVIKSETETYPKLLYKESDPSIRVIRDYFTPEIREILIDEEETFSQVKEFVGKVMPRYRSRVQRYDDTQPIFTKFNIDQQVENTMSTEIHLKSGGSIVIGSLEALVAIDVNSGKSTGSKNIEQTAFQTNIEAAEEVAKQLRLRDLGGLIVIDFIDMNEARHRKELEKRVKEVFENDRARIELGSLSKFGLFEMSRQRLRASIISKNTHKCHLCNGMGYIKSGEVVALDALRKIQSAIIVGGVKLVKARMTPGAALFLLNNKKKELSRLEEKYSSRIYVLADNSIRPDSTQFEFN